MTLKTNWARHLEDTKNYPPSNLLLKALPHVRHKANALDIGGGALKDTRYLLEQGFEVTVVDSEPSMAEIAETIHSEKLHPVVSTFADFDFPTNTFDIASANFSLPFNPPDSFNVVVEKIKASLVSGGIFCGQFFGVKDQWSSNANMTFQTKTQVEKLLSGMEVIELEEKEWEGKLANGTLKHWHVFNFIVREV